MKLSLSLMFCICVFSVHMLQAFPVALTFDDGPKPGYTEDILDILDQYGAKATFFIVGRDAALHPALILDILKRGHELGNHSYSHLRLTELTDAQIRLEIQAAQDLIFNLTQKKMVYFRSPGGQNPHNLDAILKEKKLSYGYWTLNFGDFMLGDSSGIQKKINTNDVTTLQKEILGRIKNRDIVLLHNGNPVTVKALPGLLAALKQKGVQFKTLSQMKASHD